MENGFIIGLPQRPVIPAEAEEVVLIAAFPDKIAEFVVEVLVAVTLVYYATGRLKTRYDFRRPFYRFISILFLKLFHLFFAETDFTFVFAFE